MPELPELPPPPGGFDATWQTAVLRRRRKAALAASSLAAAILVVLLIPGGGGLAALRQQPIPPGAVGGTASPGVHPASPSAAPRLPGAPGSAGAQTDGAGQGEPGVPPLDSPAPSPAAHQPPPSPPPTGRRHSYTVRRDTTAWSGSSTDCLQNQYYDASNGFCVLFPSSFTVRTRRMASYSVQVCRYTASGDGALAFGQKQEAAFLVSTNRTEWTTDKDTSAKDRQTGAHQVPVAAGHCARWTVGWDTFDDNGDPLPVSDGYSIQAAVLGGPSTTGSTFVNGFSYQAAAALTITN